ncbi:MAG: hypothetical protein D6805_00235, partial [Planctomycetota bacterium]
FLGGFFFGSLFVGLCLFIFFLGGFFFGSLFLGFFLFVFFLFVFFLFLFSAHGFGPLFSIYLFFGNSGERLEVCNLKIVFILLLGSR